MATAAHPHFAFSEYPDLRKFLIYSVFLHIALTVLIAATIIFHWKGNAWSGQGGGAEGSVDVKIVGSVGLPMPKPPDMTESRTFDPTDSLYKTLPQPKAPEPPKPEIKIPKWKEKPLPPQHRSKTFDDTRPVPDNAVAAQGGRMNVPTGTQQVPGAAAPGVSVTGQGGGDFALRYGWYVDAVRRRINQNWQQYTIDQRVRAAGTAKCSFTFTIMRDGTVKNIRIAQSSGDYSMDTSAQRALLSSSPMPPLPNDYSNSSVDVTFNFDLSLAR